ncbi:MAG TPA: S-methyl-5'-thioadenosine phosphorylase [Thermomicrobiales bacterium]|nr:S-methyl-5'-thioadenosine phosphorylase [Thermomicrobiales bacterium]
MLGVIGGTGLYELPGLKDVADVPMETPYGSPSAPFVTGTLGGTRLAFLSRHGRGHHITPSDIPVRANIFAFKSLGVTHLISINAVGSLREHLPPRTAVVPDQVIDRTVGRERTFFAGGIVAHVGLADPYCSAFRRAVVKHATAAQEAVHDGGTYICIEGPQFSTRAESNLYRQWGADIIGMTAMPEARLAREAGICYAALAMVTDYDVWHETEEDVTLEMIRKVLGDNVATGQAVVAALAHAGVPACDDGCRDAARHAITTHDDAIPDEIRERLHALLGDGATT